MPADTSLLPVAYFRKKLTPIQEASINLSSHSLQYGLTCFAGIRGYVRDGKTKIFRLQDHFNRLKNGAQIMNMPFSTTWEEFLDIIKRLVHANKPTSDFYIRAFQFSEDPSLGPSFIGKDYDFAVYMMELRRYYDMDKGLRLMISTWRKFSDSAMPTKAKGGGCYLNSALATTEARKAGYDEALMMSEEGHIVEGSVANLFIVYRDEVITPDLSEPILDGITRRTIIELLQEEGIPIRLGNIDRSMVYTCNELMLTGTAAQVVYAHSVDGRLIGQGDIAGPICQLLRKKYAEIIAGTHPKSSTWFTTI